MLKFTIKGTRIVIKNLHKYNGRIENATGDGIREGAGIVEKEAMRTAPWQTGFLRTNIKARKISNVESEVVAGAPYSAAVEDMGKKGITRGKKGGQMPFMEPAMLNNVNRVETAVAERIRRVLK